MARPTKQGIDYFPLDTSFDMKLELFIASSGAEGFGVLVVLWQMIYRDNGYFIKYDDDLVLLLRKHTLSETETIVAVIENAINRGIFSKEKYDAHGVLTSRGIQRRYLIASRKKKTVIVSRKFLLVDVSGSLNLVDSAGNKVLSSVNATKEEEKEEVKGEGEVKESKIPQKYISFSESFYKYLASEAGGKKNHPESTIISGAKTIQQLCIIDKYDFDQEVAPALRWAVADEFWSKQVRSLAPLRNKSKNGNKKFDNLFDSFSAEKNNGNGSTQEKTCSTCRKFCGADSPDKCHKTPTMRGCNEYDGK